ncbi:MAG: cation transporter [Clostridia bacterium]|nr:cation transporter [Clostridia bacterium]
MSDFLAKLFIKDYQNRGSGRVREKYGTLASVVGVVTNFILAGIKLLAGLLSASVAIIADALNNLSDAGSSVITYLSFKAAAKPADKDHPFGHARMEYIASMVVSFLILLVGFELLMDSGKTVLGLSEAQRTEITLVTIIILSASVLLKLWLAFFYLDVAKKIDSSVVKASAMDSLSDCISTLAVLVSSIVIYFTNWILLDAIVGLGVSLLILFAGGKILNETKNALLGEAPVEETVTKIYKTVEDYPDILGVHDLLVHNYGPHTFIASFHAEVDGKKDIYLLHDMIDNVEREIKERHGIQCTIHLDPIVTDDEIVTELQGFLRNILIENDIDYSVHDFRTVVGTTHTNLIFDIVLPFDAKIKPQELTSLIQEKVQKAREDVFCVITVDRG